MCLYKFGYFIILSILISACSVSSKSDPENSDDNSPPPKFKIRYYGTNFYHMVVSCTEYVFNEIHVSDRNETGCKIAKLSATNQDGSTNTGHIPMRQYGFTKAGFYKGGSTPYFDPSPIIVPKNYSFSKGGTLNLAFILVNNSAPSWPGWIRAVWGYAWIDVHLPPKLTPDDVALFTFYTDHEDNDGRRPSPPLKAIYDGLENKKSLSTSIKSYNPL